jgi:hypothetical protein
MGFPWKSFGYSNQVSVLSICRSNCQNKVPGLRISINKQVLIPTRLTKEEDDSNVVDAILYCKFMFHRPKKQVNDEIGARRFNEVENTQ